MSTKCPIPESAKKAIDKIAGNILTFQKDGKLHLHDFYTAVNAYKNSPTTAGQAYILNQAILGAEKLYYAQSGGKRLEVIGAKFTEGKNGTVTKKENMKTERERSAEPTAQPSSQEETIETESTPKPTPKQTPPPSGPPPSSSALAEMRKAPWARWLGGKVGGANAMLTKYTNGLVPDDISSYKFDVFRANDIEANLETIDSLETQEEFVGALNHNVSENTTFHTADGTELEYGVDNFQTKTFDAEENYEEEVDTDTHDIGMILDVLDGTRKKIEDQNIQTYEVNGKKVAVRNEADMYYAGKDAADDFYSILASGMSPNTFLKIVNKHLGLKGKDKKTMDDVIQMVKDTGTTRAESIYEAIEKGKGKKYKKSITTLQKKRTVSKTETKNRGQKPLDITWSESTQSEREQEQDYKGESFFTQAGLINIFRNPSKEMIIDFASIMADNWTGKSVKELEKPLTAAISFLTKSGYLDRFGAATQNYLMAGTYTTNILQALAVKTDKYEAGEKEVNPDKTGKNNRDIGYAYTLPTIITDTMFTLIPAIIEDAVTSAQDTMRREADDGNMNIATANAINEAAPVLSDMTERVGRQTLQTLGIKLEIMKDDPLAPGKKIRDKEAEGKLVSTLGLVGIQAARDVGILHIEKEDVSNDLDSNEQMDVVRMNIYKDQKHKEDTREVDKDKKEMVDTLTDMSAAISRGLVPNQKLLPSTESAFNETMNMKRTAISVTKEKIEAINEVLSKTKYTLDWDFIKKLSGLSFSNTGGKAMSRENILLVMGYKVIDDKYDNVDTKATKEAHNKALEEELDNFNEFIEDMYVQATTLREDGTANVKDMELFMDYFVAKNGRMNNDQTIGNVIQQKHYVRQLMSFKDPAAVNWKDPVEVMAFQRMILQNLGEKIEKLDKYTPEELHKVIQKRMKDPSAAKNQKQLAEWAASHEGLMSLKAYADTKSIMEYMDIVFNPRTPALRKKAAYKKLVGFTTRVTVEVDGITNGFGLSTVQYGATNLEEFKKFANRVGLFLNDQDMQTYADYKGLDGYQGLNAQVEDGLLADGKKDPAMKDMLYIFGGKAKTGLTVLGRLLAKDPLMVYFYGAGKFTISKNVGNILWEKQLASVSDNKDNPEAAADAMMGIVAMLAHMGVTHMPVKDNLFKKNGKYYPSKHGAIPLGQYFMNQDGTVNWTNFKEFSFKEARYQNGGRKVLVKSPKYDVDSSYSSGPSVDNKGNIQYEYKTFEDTIVDYYAQKIGKRYYEGADKEYKFFGKNTALIGKASFMLGEISELLLGDINLQEAFTNMTPKEQNQIIKKIRPATVTYGSKEEAALVSKILSEKYITQYDEAGVAKTTADGGKKKVPVSAGRISRTQNSNTGSKKSSVASRQRDKAALKSGAPSLIHHLDAAVMAKALLLAAKRLSKDGREVKATQIYDAVITQHDQAGEFARAYNEAMMEIVKEYSITAEIAKSLVKRHKFLTDYDNGLGQMLDDMGVQLRPETKIKLENMMTKTRDGSEGALDTEDRTKLKDMPNPDNLVKPFAQQMMEFLNHSNQQEKNKALLLSELKYINQVSDGSKDSAYELTEAIQYEPKIVEYHLPIEEKPDNFTPPISEEGINIQEAATALNIEPENTLGVLRALGKHFRHIKFDLSTFRTDKNLQVIKEDGSWDSGKGLLSVSNVLAPFKTQMTLIHEVSHMVTVDWIENHPKSREVKALVKWMGDNINALSEAVQNSDRLTDREKEIFQSRIDYITRHPDRTTMVAELMAIVIAEKSFRRAFAIGALDVDKVKKSKTVRTRIMKVIQKLANMIVKDGHPMLKYLYEFDTKHNDLDSSDLASEGYGNLMIVLNKSLAANVSRTAVKQTAKGKYNAPSNGAPNATDTNIQPPGSDIETNIYKKQAILAGYHTPDLEFSANYAKINTIPLSEHKNALMYTALASGHVWGLAVDVPLNIGDTMGRRLIDKTWESSWVKGKRASAHDYYMNEQYKGHPVMEPILSNIKDLTKTSSFKKYKNIALGIPKDIREVFNDFLTSKDTIEKNYVRQKDNAYNKLQEAMENANTTDAQKEAMIEVLMASNGYMLFDQGASQQDLMDVIYGNKDLSAWATGTMTAAQWYVTDSDQLNMMISMIEETAEALATGEHKNYEVNNGLQAAISIGLAKEQHSDFEYLFNLAVTLKAMEKTGKISVLKDVPKHIVKKVGENAQIAHNVSTVLFEADIASVHNADGSLSTKVSAEQSHRHHRLGYFKELYDKNLEAKFINFSDPEYNLGKLKEEGWNVDDAKTTIGGIFITRRNLRASFKKGIIEQEGDQARGTEIKDFDKFITNFRNSITDGLYNNDVYTLAQRNMLIIGAMSTKFGNMAIPIYNNEGEITGARYIMSRAEKKEILGLNTTDVARVSADTLATAGRKASARAHNQKARENLVSSFAIDIEEPGFSITAMEKLMSAYKNPQNAEVGNDMDTLIADDYVKEYAKHVAENNPLMLGEMAGFPLHDVFKMYNKYHEGEVGFERIDVLDDYEYISHNIPIPPQFKNEGVKYVRSGMSNTALGYHSLFLSSEDQRMFRKFEHQFYGAVNVAKNAVVAKMPQTQYFNVASNVYILRVHDVPWKVIFKNFKEINAHVSKIEAESDKIAAMRQRAMKHPEGSQKRIDYLKKVDAYEKKFKDSELYEMVKFGFIQSLTDEISSEIPAENNIFMQDLESFFSKMVPEDQERIVKKVLKHLEGDATVEDLKGFQEYAHFTSAQIMTLLGGVSDAAKDLSNQDHQLNPMSAESAKKFTAAMSNYFKRRIERGEVTPGQLIKEVFLMDGSILGSSANRFMQQADYAARKALFEELWRKEEIVHNMHNRYIARGIAIADMPFEFRYPKSKDDIKAYSRDAFVDYRVNLPEELDWLSKSGIWKFATFSIGIQRALIKMAINHPIRSIVHAVGFDEFGIGGAVTYNSLLSPDLLGYQIDPGISKDFFIPGYMRWYD